jgi:hypothetical protein
MPRGVLALAPYHLVFWKPPLSVVSPAYRFMMQTGMTVGFFTPWPINAWLIRKRLEGEDVARVAPMVALAVTGETPADDRARKLRG